MKKMILPIMLLAIGAAFYEQTKPQPNIYITAIAVAVFMFGIMWFSSKTPSKNQENNEDDV